MLTVGGDTMCVKFRTCWSISRPAAAMSREAVKALIVTNHFRSWTNCGSGLDGLWSREDAEMHVPVHLWLLHSFLHHRLVLLHGRVLYDRRNSHCDRSHSRQYVSSRDD